MHNMQALNSLIDDRCISNKFHTYYISKLCTTSYLTTIFSFIWQKHIFSSPLSTSTSSDNFFFYFSLNSTTRCWDISCILNPYMRGLKRGGTTTYRRDTIRRTICGIPEGILVWIISNIMIMVKFRNITRWGRHVLRAPLLKSLELLRQIENILA